MWAQLGRRQRTGLIATLALFLLFVIVAQVAARPLAPRLVASPGSTGEVVISMAALQFSPPHVIVDPGATVRWRNDDTTFHRVVADDGSFSSPLLAPGQEYSTIFAVSGHFPYHCDLHPDMRGTVAVGQAQWMPWMVRNNIHLTPTPTATAAPPPGPTSVVIGPAGGELTAPDGSAEVIVPEGAVDRKTTFDYAPATPAPPAGYGDAGNAFTLNAESGGTPVTQFSQPITLALRCYDAAGDQANGLGLFVQTADGATWEEVESTIGVDPCVVTAAVDHLTTFALFARILPPIYWKAGGWPDYAPSGVPDFDQKQGGWKNVGGQWTHCGPVAAANSLWWFDSVFEPAAIPPPAISDGYPLVQSYSPGVWDDHDPRNVLPFVNNLAGLAGTGPAGTDVVKLSQAIQNYLAVKGLAAAYTVALAKTPDFAWVAEEVLRSEDVILLIGFWQQTAADWRRIGGHYVTVAGADPVRRLIAFSDPFANAAEVGGWGRVLPAAHPPGHGSGLHNDARLVSHDLYRVIQTNSPGGNWGPALYTRWLNLANFSGLNVPTEFRPYTTTYNPWLRVVAEVEYAIAVSPVVALPTRTPTRPPTITPTPTATPSRPPTITPTPSATTSPTETRIATPTVTLTISVTPRPTQTPTATPTFFWKAGGWIDYAPSGMPDFDQRQDRWGVGAAPGAADWRWTYCGPVAAANSLWWFDSKFEPKPVAPPVINDGYPLVQSYNPLAWDDHDPLNVDSPATAPGPNGEFVEELAWLMDTDGQRTGAAHRGTRIGDLFSGIQKHLANKGLAGHYTLTRQKQPTFQWVVSEVLRSEDVILLLGFWELQPTGSWVRVGGHYVTLAGASLPANALVFSDPIRDNAEAGGPGRVLPFMPHMPPHSPTLHNDAAYVSHDIWNLVNTNSPGGQWGPVGYGTTDLALNFAEQNVPEEFIEFSGPYTGGPLQVEVEYAIAVSPVETTPTPTASPTERPTATPTWAPTWTQTATATQRPTDLPTAPPTSTPTRTRTATATVTRTATATGTATKTGTPTMTATITPTPTVTPTPTPTVTPTPTQKPVLTGVSSTFRHLGEGVIEIMIHVQDPTLDGVIFDIEIFYAEQFPPWGMATPLGWPAGWQPMPNIVGGIGFMTHDAPLKFCQPAFFTIQVIPPQIGTTIWIHATDKDHNNLGYIISRLPSR